MVMSWIWTGILAVSVLCSVLTGSGSGEYSILIDGVLLRTETVNFDA